MEHTDRPVELVAPVTVEVVAPGALELVVPIGFKFVPPDTLGLVAPGAVEVVAPVTVGLVPSGCTSVNPSVLVDPGVRTGSGSFSNTISSSSSS